MIEIIQTQGKELQDNSNICGSKSRNQQNAVISLKHAGGKTFALYLWACCSESIEHWTAYVECPLEHGLCDLTRTGLSFLFLFPTKNSGYEAEHSMVFFNRHETEENAPKQSVKQGGTFCACPLIKNRSFYVAKHSPIPDYLDLVAHIYCVCCTKNV